MCYIVLIDGNGTFMASVCRYLAPLWVRDACSIIPCFGTIEKPTVADALSQILGPDPRGESSLASTTLPLAWTNVAEE